MKILVTGGAGFIGSHVVDKYIKQGHDVIVVDNFHSGKKENVNRAAKFYQIDIRSKKIERIFKIEKPDIINHHAAQISIPASLKDPIFDAEVNTIGFLNILQCSIKCGTKKIILASSGGAIYGEATEYPTSEKCPPIPLSPYAITKLISEYYLNFYRHKYGLDYTILRYANIYGPRQIPYGEAGVVAIFIENLLSGKPSVICHFPDEPDGMIRDYCYVEDVVKASIYVLEKGSGEIFNIGTGKPTRTKDLYKDIYKLISNDNSALKTLSSGPARDGDIKKSCLNITKAKKILGWVPKFSLKEGLTKTIQWYINNYNKKTPRE